MTAHAEVAKKIPAGPSPRPVSEKEARGVAKKLHPLEIKLLPRLRDGTTYLLLTKETGMQEVEVMRALQWLENKGAVTLTPKNTTQIILDENGEKALRGLPERAFLEAVKAGADRIETISRQAKLDRGEANACIGLLKKTGRIDLGANITITKLGEGWLKKESLEEQFLKRLASGPVAEAALAPEEVFAYDALKKRKAFLKTRTEKDRIVALTPLGEALTKLDLRGGFADRLTPDDLASGAWKKKEYRAYDVTINVPAKAHGKPHFVNEAIAYIKQVWLELGFTEMTGTNVQTAFWDLDTLFVPQDHPAREMQDTFYLGDPERAAELDTKLFERVKRVHEDGGDTGSDGWQYTFSKEESEQLLLRTHTTVLSAQTLDAIRRGAAAMPGKYFSVWRVYRNEALDWKHLFEFHQVEGIVVDPEANFPQLLGYLKLFFAKLGYSDVRVRPAHFPYTEPSVEVEGYHPGKEEWVELGGAGIFRPEVTKTLIGKEVPVLAWGLGMERSISEYYKITDLRDLYGNDLKQLRAMKKWVK